MPVSNSNRLNRFNVSKHEQCLNNLTFANISKYICVSMYK